MDYWKDDAGLEGGGAGGLAGLRIDDTKETSPVWTTRDEAAKLDREMESPEPPLPTPPQQ